MLRPRLGVVGATGAVGTVTLGLLAERAYHDVRAFASSRSAGRRVAFADGELPVEEATPAALAAGDLDLCFFSVGTATSRELVPAAREAGVVCVDKSDAFRLTEGVPRHDMCPCDSSSLRWWPGEDTRRPDFCHATFPIPRSSFLKRHKRMLLASQNVRFS